jgi:hypothetical protein|tara:strand:- start:253 stop:426 length:174 start_codon:yes stop_codon:yes gene_type:complete
MILATQEGLKDELFNHKYNIVDFVQIVKKNLSIIVSKQTTKQERQQEEDLSPQKERK